MFTLLYSYSLSQRSTSLMLNRYYFMTTGVRVNILYLHKRPCENNDESRGSNIPPISTMPRFMGNWKMFIQVTLANAKQASFTPTCSESRPKSELTEIRGRILSGKNMDLDIRQTTAWWPWTSYWYHSFFFPKWKMHQFNRWGAPT